MTEEWWRKYNENKKKNTNPLYSNIESDIKRKFKNEKSPEEMYSMCMTDNNYWKHYRWSENLDPDSISLVLCKDYGCDLMYCQVLSMDPKNEMYGCEDQMNTFRQCYVQEKRKFNSLHKEEEWLKDKNLIPEYIDNQLKILKEQKARIKLYGDMKVIKIDENKMVNVPKEVTQKEDSYFK